MALDATEQELFDFAWQCMPRWYRARERATEEVAMFAKIWGAVKKAIQYWNRQNYISTADRAISTDPDWLEMHAQDRGTHLADGETTAVARIRLVQVPDAVTPNAIKNGAQAIVDAAGVLGTVAMDEMPRDCAYLGPLTAASGTGGTFYEVPGSETEMYFVPSTPLPYVPFVGNTEDTRPGGWVMATGVILSGCSSAANDGTFGTSRLVAVNDASGDPTLVGIVFTNATGVAGADATCSWQIYRQDYTGEIVDNTACVFVNRGYRVWRSSGYNGEQCANGGVIIMLPYGCTEGVRLAVREMLRTKMAAGFKVIVERRLIP